MQSSLRAFTLACALMAVSGTLAALPCVGFTDVDTTSPFCGAVAWLKNRDVTTGCTSSAYCPDSSVTRAQMALFMNRLERQFPPSLVDVNGKWAGALDGEREVLLYRRNGEVLAVRVRYDVRTYRYGFFDEGDVYYGNAGCFGAAYGNADPGYLQEYPSGGRRATLVARGVNGGKLLFVTAPYPHLPGSFPTNSLLRNGVCYDSSVVMPNLRPLTFFEDLTTVFAEPFVLK